MNHRYSVSTRRVLLEWVAKGVFTISFVVIFSFLLGVLFSITKRGIGAINWTFLSSFPMEAMTKGGILPCIVGSTLLAVGSTLLALPIGVLTGIYLSEYAGNNKLVDFIRFGVNNLAGVPSVVFGLFGLALFVVILELKVSVLSGVLTLACLSLPLIVSVSEEAIRAVPTTYREASYALGATKFQTTFKVVLPSAFPGILTSAILALSRAAGETAPIMFTAAVYFSKHLPGSLFDPVMALPYHIYVLATAGVHIEKTRPLQFGTAIVLIVLVLGLNLLGIIYRARIQKRR